MSTNECQDDVNGDVPDLQTYHREQHLKLGGKKSDRSLAQIILPIHKYPEVGKDSN